ncbi:MAG: peptidylprolyl isomerase [Nodosilinea sp.]
MTNPSAIAANPVIHSLQVGGEPLSPSDLIPKLRRYDLLPALVKEIIIDQAIVPIHLTEEERATAIDQFLQVQKITSQDQRDRFLRQRGLPPDDFDSLACRDLKLQKFKAETWGQKLESYFLQRKAQLDQVRYSLIRTQEPGLAQELYFRIQDDGQPFADLARQFSAGPEAQVGGLIGPVELSVPHPHLARLLSISQPGQLWPPSRIGDWFVVVRLEQFIAARLDDPTRQRLLDELFQTWLTEQVQAVIHQSNG